MNPLVLLVHQLLHHTIIKPAMKEAYERNIELVALTSDNKDIEISWC